jgi:hypothetical protein
MRRTVSSNTIPAITAASSFRPCLRYSAPWSRKAQLTGKHRRRRWCGVRPGSPAAVFGREEAPSTTIGLRRGCRDCRVMAFLPRYYLADISQIECRIAGQVQYSTAPAAATIRLRSPPCVADQGAGGCQQWQRDVINSATGAFSGVAGPVPPSGLRGEHWVVLEFRHTFADRTRWSAETFSPTPPGILPWS